MKIYIKQVKKVLLVTLLCVSFPASSHLSSEEEQKILELFNGDFVSDIFDYQPREHIKKVIEKHPHLVHKHFKFGGPLFHKALIEGDFGFAKYLISKNVDPDALVTLGRTSLIQIAALLKKADENEQKKLLQAAQFLIDENVDKNAQDAYKKTALHYITRLIVMSPEALKMAELLVQNGARADLADENGLTSLEEARNWGVMGRKKSDIYRILTKGKRNDVIQHASTSTYSDLNPEEEKGIYNIFFNVSYGSIYLISQYRPEDSIIKFIKKYPQVIHKDHKFAHDILYNAIEVGSFELAKYLILEGINPEASNDENTSFGNANTTVLIRVAGSLKFWSNSYYITTNILEKALAFIKFIIDSKKVNLNTQNPYDRRTALHYIVKLIVDLELSEANKTRIKVVKEVAELLVENEALTDLADENGFTPLDIAKNWGTVLEIEGEPFDIYKLLQTGKRSKTKSTSLATMPIYSDLSLEEEKEIHNLFFTGDYPSIGQYRPEDSIIKFIKKYPQFISKNYELGRLVLDTAIEKGSFKLAKHLIFKEGIHPETPLISSTYLRRKKTPLILVAEMLEKYTDTDTLEEALEFAKFLIDSKRVNLNTRDASESTALLYITRLIVDYHQTEAPSLKSEEMTEKLAINKTRIRIAKKMAELFVENGALVDIVNIYDLTPLGIAKTWGQVIEVEGEPFDLYKLLQTGKKSKIKSFCRTVFDDLLRIKYSIKRLQHKL